MIHVRCRQWGHARSLQRYIVAHWTLDSSTKKPFGQRRCFRNRRPALSSSNGVLLQSTPQVKTHLFLQLRVSLQGHVCHIVGGSLGVVLDYIGGLSNERQDALGYRLVLDKDSGRAHG
jgi:hypothetical protein